MPEKQKQPPRWSPRKRLGCALVVLSLCYVFRTALALALFLIWLYLDQLLGLLASWAMKDLCPKHFHWKISYILIRPNLFAGASCPAEIVFGDWTWYNPIEFDNHSPYILHINKITFTLDFHSLYTTLRGRTPAINVHSVVVDGLDFHAERNKEDALNLWVALDLPDQDVNVVVNSLRGLRVDHFSERALPQPEACAPSAPKNRRGASFFWQSRKDLAKEAAPEATGEGEGRVGEEKGSESRRSETGRVEGGLAAKCGSALCFRPLSAIARLLRGDRQKAISRARSSTFKDEFQRDAPLRTSRPPLQRRNTDVFDPRRRPRWGVPVRLDIHKVTVLGVEAQLMDLITVHRHSHSMAHMASGDTTIRLGCVEISREGLVQKDPRRSAGIYLGELVWALIHALVLKILTTQPSRLIKNSTLAVAFAVHDVAHYTIAKALEMALNAPVEVMRQPRALYEALDWDVDKKIPQLKLSLVCGRRLFAHAQPPCRSAAVSTHVIALLYHCGEDGVERFVDAAISKVRLWTRRPCWKEQFLLGPVKTLETAKLKVIVIHHDRISGERLFSSSASNTAAGEFDVPLAALLQGRLRGKRPAVGWFQLGDPTAATYSALSADFAAARNSRRAIRADSGADTPSTDTPIDDSAALRDVLNGSAPDEKADDGDSDSESGTASASASACALSKRRSTFRALHTLKRSRMAHAQIRRVSFKSTEALALLTGEIKIGIQVTNPDLLITHAPTPDASPDEAAALASPEANRRG
ncbi:hypothetical protein M885DRAFT_529278 [Pelagophyceae sp. CCMP2097]|nr:hypothetical protein M885DRAFT_529278 [Pelagophyceae sp. CCMP2097]|mmetsp:Transcript_15286/g.51404  ORF Transcript_15286/g.51404 Transcript_15286/m.51404 type:complete len:756 (+) Transcript_15286:132-2399(+)